MYIEYLTTPKKKENEEIDDCIRFLKSKKVMS